MKPSLVIPRWWLPGLAGVFLLALVVRLLVLYEISSSPAWGILSIDSAFYNAWAKRIAAGDWLGEGVFFMAPLYPYFLGGLYAVFGANPTTALVIQAAIGSASCVLLAIAGNLFFGHRVGLLAGLLLAIYSTAVFSDIQIQKSVLDLFLIGLLLVAMAKALGDPSFLGWFLSGAALGGLMLSRENAVVFLPVLAICLIVAGRGLPRKALLTQGLGLLLGLALLLAPVALRNVIRGGEFYLTTAQFGYNLYIGNNPRSEGTYNALIPGKEGTEQEDARAVAETALGRKLTFAEVSRYWRDQALDFIITQPGPWLRLMARKAFLLTNALELPDTYDQYSYGDWSGVLRLLTSLFHFGILMPLATAGAIVAWNRRSALWPLYVLLVAYASSVMIFFVMSRYRLPLVPFLVLFAAALIAEIVVIPTRWKTLFPGPLAAILVIAVVANIPPKEAAEKSRFKATMLTNIAVALSDKPDRSEEIVRLLAESVRLNPHFGPSHYYLGLAYKNLGRYSESLAALRTSASLLPEYPDPYYEIGQVYFAQGQPEVAIAWYRKALLIDPEEPLWFINLSKALRAIGDFAGEKEALQRAVNLGAQDPEVRSALEEARSSGSRSGR